MPFEGPLKGTALAAKRATIQVVLTLILRRAEATIVTSIISEAEARALGARRIACIPNGVDLDLFTELECGDVVASLPTKGLRGQAGARE